MSHENLNGIPIVIGATGHRDPRKESVPALREAVRAKLDAIKRRCPHSRLVLLTSLAEGGDQICAEEALKMGIALNAVLPRPLDDFRKDFSGEALNGFDRLVGAAQKVFVAPRAEKEPEAPSPSDGYRQAGIYLARHSHVLLALWDGTPPLQGGCGTAEAVSFMLSGAFQNARGALFKGPCAAVIAIHTPRLSRDSAGAAGTVTLHESAGGTLFGLLDETDAFNAQAAALKGGVKETALMDGETLASLPPALLQIHRAYQDSGTLSLLNRDKYYRCMRHLAFLSVGLVLSFLLYDELEANIFLPLYAVLGLLSFWTVHRAKGLGYHERYLSYRALAESLRVQFYLLLSGIDAQVSDYFTWSQKCEAGWIGRAADALLIGAEPIPGGLAAVQTAWIEGQLAYHQKKTAPTTHRLRLNDAVARGAMVLSVALFLLTLILEFTGEGVITAMLLPGGLPAPFLPHAGQGVALRGVIKVLLGVSSAASLFMANYYGKLSLRQKRGDHERMAALAETALEQLQSGLIPREEVLMHLAREEIIENGVWLSYCRDNAPGVSI